MIELKILYERRPANYIIKRRIEVLENMANAIKAGRLPLKAVLLIFVRGETSTKCLQTLREINDLLKHYNCNPRLLNHKDLSKILIGSIHGDLSSEEANLKLMDILEETLKPVYREFSVFLGRELDTGAPVFLPLWDKGSLHAIILGPTGKGKTTLLATIANRISTLYRSISVIGIDPKGDFSLLVDTLERHSITTENATTLIHLSYKSGYLSLPIIGSLLGLSKSNDLLNLAKILETCTPHLEKPEAVILYEKLKAFGLFFEKCREKHINEIKTLFSLIRRGGLVIDLSSLPDSLKNIILWAILSFIIEEFSHGPAKEPRSILLIDEAWRLLTAPRLILQRLFKEGRSYGVSIIMATQDPNDLADEIWNNVSSIIVFGSYDKEYIESIKRAVKISAEDISRIRKLRRGEAYARFPGFNYPVYIYIEPETSRQTAPELEYREEDNL